MNRKIINKNRNKNQKPNQTKSYNIYNIGVKYKNIKKEI